MLALLLWILGVFVTVAVSVAIPTLAFWYALGLPLLKAFVLALGLAAVTSK